MYETLSVYGYKQSSEVEKEYQRRLNSLATVKTSLLIKPFSQQKEIHLPQEYPLFYMMTPGVAKLIEEILNNSKEISMNTLKMPKDVIAYLKKSRLINEIKSTNDIEGVSSTKAEIDDAITAQDTQEDVRFKRTVSMYMNILNSEKLTIANLQDFRHIR